MLNEIKKIIGQKREFLESANILFDEVNLTSTTLFEESILGEADEGAVGTTEPTMDGAPIPSTEPNVPSNTEADDLLSVEINSRNGVVRDTLPVEPKGVESEPAEGNDGNNDIMGTSIGDEPAATPVTESAGEPTSDDDLFNEAISLGGDDNGDGKDDGKSGDKKDGDGDEGDDDILDAKIDDTDDKDGEPKEENDVTAAVKDKIAEAEEGEGDGESSNEPPAEDPTDDGDKGDDGADSASILDKLDNLQKNIFKVKDEIKKSIG